MGESTGIGVDSSEGLLALAQLYVVEIHPWGSQLRSLEQPDTLTFDLDPGPELDWIDVVAMAKELRDVLGQIGLQSWVKTSGGKGLHICVPIQPDLEWDDIKNFCHGVALLMERKNPKRALATISKAKRTNKIFIDYLRNGRGATSVAAYSPRARTGIPISMPITWDELEFIEGPAFVKLRSLSDYLAKRSHDPWADFLNTPQDLARIIR
jgi:bifunctional non-homologous end joining protein LigD